MNLFKKQISTVLISALALTGLVSSCFDSNESETVVTDYNNALITGVSLNTNSNVCAALSSYAFTIDHLGVSDTALINRYKSLCDFNEYSLEPGILFNPDSLPIGSIADSIKVSLTTTNASAVEIFQYNDRMMLLNYTNFKDTQIVWFDDYAVTRIQVMAYDGVTNKSYFMKVNVHQMDGDTIRWKYLAQDLFDMTEVIDQRVDTIGNKLYWFTTLNDNSQQVREADLMGKVAEWSSPVTVTSPAQIDLGTMLNWNDALYAVGGGQVLTSTDGINWVSASSDYTFVNLLGCQMQCKLYAQHLCAIAKVDGQNQFVRSDDGKNWSLDTLVVGSDTTSIVPAKFPVTGYSRPISVAYNKKSNTTTSRLYICGGELADGTLTASTWSSDGTAWVEFEQVRLRANRRPSIVRYTIDQDYPDTFWIMQTGEMEDGSVNDSLYYSQNSGITWKSLPTDYLKMGDTEHLAEFGCSSAFFNPETYSIYFFGGKDAEGKQQSNIVTGNLGKLSMLKKR